MTLALTYPGGELKTITIAATPGGTTTNKTPGARKRWIILYGKLYLDTDGTAANRRIVVNITDGTNIILNLGRSSADVTANQLSGLVFGSFAGVPVNWEVGESGLDLRSVVPIDNLIIEGADEFRISIASGQAGDSYSGYIRVLELGL